MTRFVAALLVARGRTVAAAVDGRVTGTAGLGPFQAEALLAAAAIRGRKQRLADDELTAELAAAMREVPGEHLARDAGLDAWHARQQRGGEPR